MIVTDSYDREPDLYFGHMGGVGDLLVSRYADGLTIAKRPGRDRTDLTWGPQVELEVAS